jgi:uncharacterized protein
MKYVVAAVIVVGLIGLLRMLRRRNRDSGTVRATRDVPRDPPSRLPMLRCAHCGVHLPGQDAIVVRGTAYCSDEHRREHESGQS